MKARRRCRGVEGFKSDNEMKLGGEESGRVAERDEEEWER